ncbi:MAG TPA: SRPBCC family protein [Thermoleophilaceae bacterium]|nr:SRPBCC family protein [Thermoleophilaceae bacterium]
MAGYAFLTTWLLRAPRTAVWNAIEDAPAWPQWWHGVEAVTELDGGDDRRVGSRYRVRWRSFVPYSIEFDFEVERVEPPGAMSGHATGDLEGVGTWRLYEQDDVTAVTYDWRVRTTKRWMNAVAPLARPVFEWNHDWVMARGGEGLARRLGVELLAAG